jgi:hypothetical protein
MRFIVIIIVLLPLIQFTGFLLNYDYFIERIYLIIPFAVWSNVHVYAGIIAGTIPFIVLLSLFRWRGSKKVEGLRKGLLLAGVLLYAGSIFLDVYQSFEVTGNLFEIITGFSISLPGILSVLFILPGLLVLLKVFRPAGRLHFLFILPLLILSLILPVVLTRTSAAERGPKLSYLSQHSPDFKLVEAGLPIKESREITVLMAATCNHCRELARKIAATYVKNPDIPFRISVFGTEKEYEFFLKYLHWPEGLAVEHSENISFAVQVTGGLFPAAVWRTRDEIQYMLSGSTINLFALDEPLSYFK